MKPYEIEIFDQQFNFIFNSLLDPADFVYQFDVLSPNKSTIPITKDFKPSLLSDAPRAPKGWYIRIFRDNEEYQGVITGYEAGESQGKIEYSQLVTLFDNEILVDTAAILSTNIETYIKSLLISTFVTNTDTQENIYGLSASTITVGSTTTGLLPYTDSTDEKSILNFLNDIISPAAKTYQILTLPSFDVSQKTMSVYVGIYNHDAVTIEADLPGIIDPTFTIRKISDELNRADIYDEYKDLWHYFYLHTDGTYNTTDTDRIIPVNNTIVTFNSYDLAKAQIDASISENQSVISKYLTNSKTLTASEVVLLEDAMENLFDKYLRDYAIILVNVWRYPENLDYVETQSRRSNGTFKYYEDDANHVGFLPSSYRVTNTPTDGDYINRIFIGPDTVEIVSELSPDAYEPTPYRNSHVWVTNTWIQVGARLSGDPPTESSGSISGFSGVLDKSVVSSALSDYKNSARYEADIIALANQLTNTQSEKLAKEAFSKNKYSNLIEVTVEKDNDLINPMSMQIGQVVNIIHDGVSYNSILSGREIQKNGLVKLIFGTIRLELTKILNMKGI